jgi:hypothetical protein
MQYSILGNDQPTYHTLSSYILINNVAFQAIGSQPLHRQTKGAITKEFFPSVESRLAVNLKLITNVITIMTGHGNFRSYLHRLKIIGSTECPCNHGIQTADRLILQCKRLINERQF